MNNYGFTLDWHELPGYLRREKIDEYIDFHNKNEGDDDQLDVNNPKDRNVAARDIEARFPMYF